MIFDFVVKLNLWSEKVCTTLYLAYMQFRKKSKERGFCLLEDPDLLTEKLMIAGPTVANRLERLQYSLVLRSWEPVLMRYYLSEFGAFWGHADGVPFPAVLESRRSFTGQALLAASSKPTLSQQAKY
jgi:hypothetical protein